MNNLNKKTEGIKELEEDIKEKNVYIIKNNEDIKGKNEYIKEKNEDINENINKLIKENKNLKEKNYNLTKENNDLNINNRDLKNKSKFLNNEIKDLKEKLNRYPFLLENNEELISIIIYSRDEKIIYPIPCKNTNIINDIEKELYKVFPEYSNNKNIFLYKGKKINKFETLQKNKIKNGDILILDRVDN